MLHEPHLTIHMACLKADKIVLDAFVTQQGATNTIEEQFASLGEIWNVQEVQH